MQHGKNWAKKKPPWEKTTPTMKTLPHLSINANIANHTPPLMKKFELPGVYGFIVLHDKCRKFVFVPTYREKYLYYRGSYKHTT